MAIVNNSGIIIVFPHVERTGGSTIHAWFYYLNEIKQYHIHPGGLSLNALLTDSSGDLTYLGGHFKMNCFYNSAISSTQQNPYFFGVVRPTIDRLLSMYKLWVRSPEWLPGIEALDTLNLRSFYKKIRLHFFQNDLCKAYSTAGNFLSVLDSFKNNLQFLGHCDHLDLVMSRLIIDFPSESNSIKKSSGLVLNKGALIEDVRFHALGLDDDFIQMVLQDNAEDEKLVNHVVNSGFLANS